MAKVPELRQKITPLIGGAQIQNKLHKSKGIGTLACIVYDNETNKPLGLTNRHILVGNVGSTVIQPAKKKRIEEYIIGNVLRKGGKHYSTDYAVFELDLNNRDFDKKNSFFGLEGKVTDFVEPILGLNVQKISQYTGHTYGIISKVYENGTFSIKPNPHKPSKQISQGGDSGAMWITDEVNFKAVGLHARGEKQPNIFRRKKPDRATAISISKIIDDLEIKL